jgi:hypothetical protein
MTLVLVDREELDNLLRKAWTMFELLADDSGYEQRYLHPNSELVTLAVQAGLQIPGPMEPGTVPPAPPPSRVVGLCQTYRVNGDPRLRCTRDQKVVYTTEAKAVHAAELITLREQPMRAYLGPCGHWHLTSHLRRKK